MGKNSKNTIFNELYQEFIYKRSYSRWIDTENRRESWDETIDRYKSFFILRVPERHREEYEKATEQIRSLEIMPSMRALWTAGKALERENLCAFNCAFAPIDSIKSFADMMYILMCGTGFGFSVERQYINCLPDIPAKFEVSNKEIIFADSKKGWAEGFYKVLKYLYKGFIPVYNLEKIRPAGARLKVFGGRASGPVPLDKLLKFSINIITNNAGRKLSSINCYDICCMIADIVVSGGVRRAACLSLSNLSDDRMAKAKSGSFWLENPQRQLCNNSIAFTEKPSSRKFLSEWIKLIESRTGERGIFNREGAKYQILKNGRRDINYDFGCNPCQPGWATVLTPTGIKTFNDIDVGDSIWSEDNWVNITNKKSSGIKDVYRYRTNAGVFYGTENHRIVSKNKKIEVDIAESIDTLKGKPSFDCITPKFVVDGLVIGDGSVHKASNNLVYLHIGKDDQDYFISDISKFILKFRPGIHDTAYEIKTGITYDELPLTYERRIPNRFKFGPPVVVKSFLRGIYSANGSVCGSRVTLKSSSKYLVEDIQIMLSSIGIKSYITKNKSKTVTFKNGDYTCRRSYDINITTDTPIFQDHIGFIQLYKTKKLKDILLKRKIIHKTTFDITNKEYVSTEEVFNITVDGKNHTYWTGGCNVSNCSEINLRPHELCNLTECIIRKDDTLGDLKEKVRGATILGCVQSTLTDFKFIGREWKHNCEEERLLGVSLTGIMDHPILNNKNKDMKKWLHELKEEAIQTAEVWSNRLNINMPAAITTCKPSGSVSQLCNTSSGIHTRYSPYYIRRVRVSSTDTLTKFLMDKGVPNKPETGFTRENALNFVFEFPIKSPDTSRMRDEMTVIEQLEFYKTVMQYWIEHNISTTIFVKDDEWPEVAAWVFKNWNSICGLSFLPYDTGVYELAPYQEISEEEYYDLLETFPKDIDFNDLNLIETEDVTEGAATLACTANNCEL